ncbi:MAG TPA: hypothetical protein VKZ18_24845 [Polyangia bacterium]|nr:hypothetical protein [Polyangia bacterium]
MNAPAETTEIVLPDDVQPASFHALPQDYRRAVMAINRCARVDDAKGWADKAKAMAVYARQMKDESLFNAATKIRARAVRRYGELLEEIQPAKNQHDAGARARTGGGTSRTNAAAEAGLSKRQKDTALRVAALPEETFNALVETEKPATVSELARAGTKTRATRAPVVDVTEETDGDTDTRSLEEYRAGLKAAVAIEGFATFVRAADVALVARGTRHDTSAALARRLNEIASWCNKLRGELR